MHLSKPTECTTPRVNRNVNYGLWVIMMCPCGFIGCNSAPLWRGMLIMGEAVHVWVQGVYGKPLYLPLNFAVNLQLL